MTSEIMLNVDGIRMFLFMSDQESKIFFTFSGSESGENHR